jgi:hypothetical protein
MYIRLHRDEISLNLLSLSHAIDLVLFLSNNRQDLLLKIDHCY